MTPRVFYVSWEYPEFFLLSKKKRYSFSYECLAFSSLVSCSSETTHSDPNSSLTSFFAIDDKFRRSSLSLLPTIRDEYGNIEEPYMNEYEGMEWMVECVHSSHALLYSLGGECEWVTTTKSLLHCWSRTFYWVGLGESELRENRLVTPTDILDIFNSMGVEIFGKREEKEESRGRTLTSHLPVSEWLSLSTQLQESSGRVFQKVR